MVGDPRYDILFEPVRIGPVTAPNRFYQVPHCTGMGWQRPRTLAAMRGVKAEGGWGVVCSEYCSIHPSSDDVPFPSAALWDQSDIAANALTTEKIHAHGALAGVELWYGGASTVNWLTREVPRDVATMPALNGEPVSTRAMDKADIREYRRWHRDAAQRARSAGFDIVYVYATHSYMLANFLSPETNRRTDEYGGSLENHLRLVREVIEDTKEAVGDTCAVAVRFSVDDGDGGDGIPVHAERREMFELLAELPDLWDINIADYSYEMGTSRYVKEAALEPYMAFVKSVTSKPVVTVGRFTSPDTMASQVRRGIFDLVAAARPSIADPFLPKKIAEGRPEDIRECIGCNVCYAGDAKGVPIRCTQNPTMGEEWRPGWHPEVISTVARPTRVLVVGAGPAGLEAAEALGHRGCEVTLAEAGRELGGRVTREATLPGLGEWIRVRDHRVLRIEAMANVEVFRESRLGVEDVLAFGADHVVVATGARWRADGFGRSHTVPMGGLPAGRVFTPDDIMAGRLPSGRVLVYDDDHTYMGPVLAERLLGAGLALAFATPADRVASWASATVEQYRSQRLLLEAGVEAVTAHGLGAFDGTRALLRCGYTDREREVAADALLLVTARLPEDRLYRELMAHPAVVGGAGPSVARISDCEAPGLIAHAVYAGHRFARELGMPEDERIAVPRDGVATTLT